METEEETKKKKCEDFQGVSILHSFRILGTFTVITILTAHSEGIADLERLRFHFPHIFFRLLSSSPLRRL